MSAESIARLYKVNQMRDILYEHSNELENLGVFKVVAFGSAITGLARQTSDIDICFIMDDDQRMVDSAVLEKKKYDLETKIKTFFSCISDNFAFQVVGENQRRDDLLHIWVKFTGTQTPRFAKNNILLWQN